jgi:hypothetical protein
LTALLFLAQGKRQGPTVERAGPAVELMSTQRAEAANDAAAAIPEPSAEQREIKPAAPTPADTQHTKAAASPQAEPAPAGPYSIAGMVMDESGRGVPGIPVTAYPKNLFGDDPSGKTSGRTAFAGIDGFYEIDGVADGEYRLRTDADDRYEAAEAMVRAGADGADLILREWRAGVQIIGTVRGDGEALAGAEITAVGQPAGAASTDEDGAYELTLQVEAGKRGYTLRFQRDGYRERRSVLTADDLAGQGRIRVDADLEPEQALVEVTGTVHDKQGKPVAGQTVQLYSEAARQRYTAVSDRGGEIEFTGVETSDDYMVAVRPADTYRDYVALGVGIGVTGADLDITLEPRSYGRLIGQMVNPDGLPVPGFSLWLRNRNSVNQPARLVTGDQQGFFDIQQIAAGPLVFETRGSPLISISGIQLAPGETKEVMLVLDWGTHQVAGLVMDDTGRPVSASELYVTSVRTDGGLRAQVVRRAVTDETGFFLVGQVGSGYHTIRVDAPGFRSEVLDHQVGSDNPEVIIRLERAYSYGM